MNFNFSNKSEYSLNTSLTSEMIGLYGVLTKFLITEKINIDDNVFGDFSHMKTDSESIYEINMLPENSDDWDSEGFNMDGFGLSNFENVILFASKGSFDGIIEFKKITGNLIIFPNNKIMEITDCDATVPGINNLYTYNDTKSVYKLTCKPYSAKLINELDQEDIAYEGFEDVGSISNPSNVTEDDDSITDEVEEIEDYNSITDEVDPYDVLDEYFANIINEKDDQDTEAEVTEQVQTVQDGGDDAVDTIKEEPYVDNSEDDVWGTFE